MGERKKLNVKRRTANTCPWRWTCSPACAAPARSTGTRSSRRVAGNYPVAHPRPGLSRVRLEVFAGHKTLVSTSTMSGMNEPLHRCSLHVAKIPFIEKTHIFEKCGNVFIFPK